mgnify:CR=1 FL=1
MNGYFQAMGFAPGSRLLSNWWGHKNRGFVYSFYVGMSGFSSVLAYFLPIVILGSFGLDWRWIFRLSVVLMLFGAIVMFVTVREKPEDLGLSHPADDRSADEEAEGADESICGWNQAIGLAVCKYVWRFNAKKPDHRHRGLRAHRARRCDCRTAKKGDELPPSHSTTPSARPSSESGMVRPKAFAVFRLRNSSTLVDCCTGRSAGFSPLRMWPV